MVLVGLVSAWLLVLVVRLVDLQVVRHEEFVKRARRQQERTVELPPRRGAMLDAEGRPLAVSVLVDSVFAIPSDVVDPAATAAELSGILGVPRAELARKLASPDRDFVWVARRLPEALAHRVSSRKLPGIRLFKEPTRRYPQGPLAASLVGYVGLDNQGLGGLEHRYDAEVRGRPAFVTFLRDAAQRTYAARNGGSVTRAGSAVEGASLVLTLLGSIQHVAERELDRMAEESRPRGATLVAMDPESGAVLALATWPPFDPNRYQDAGPEAWRCRAVTDTYEPGSTFKVFTAAAALERGSIGVDELIDCGGGALTIGSTTIHEHGHNRFGVLPLVDVLAQSSNVGAARIGMGLGRGPFFEAVRAFGFGSRTGIELDGETAGLLRDPSTWSALTLPTMSFGQEVGVTVLQITRAFAAVAGGGLLPAPHVVSEVRFSDGRVRRRELAPKPRVISEETARNLRRLLTKVVETGTGKLAAVPGFTVAGKTGTAQKAVPGGGYARDRHVASFIGMVPAEAPRVVIAVVVDEPKGKYYGGDVAAPVFAAVAEEALRALRVPARPRPESTRPEILVADLASGAAAAVNPTLRKDLVPASRRSAPADSPPGVVPDVNGRSAAQAVRELARSGYASLLKGSGFVVAQDPPAGAALSPGGRCTLWLSLSPPDRRAALAIPAPPAPGEGPEGRP